MPFSFRLREDNIERLAREEFDILVIGGGITGTGIAWDAALRGFKTALLDKGDFASGTSSRSSRLIHGGLRYLQRLELDLVYEACRERGILLRRLAPHLVRPLPFLYPVYKGEGVGYFQLRAGMWLYDGLAFFRNIRRHRMLGAREVLSLEPALRQEGLQGAACFYDCRGDDARITLAVARAAHRAGAVVANYVEAIELLKSRGKIAGAGVRDLVSGRDMEVKAKVVVNAAGPWGDRILALDGSSSGSALRLTKGIHLVLRRDRIGHTYAISISSPRDGRFVFLIPWGDFTLIGTTDTDYQGNPDRVYADGEDVGYLLEAVNHALPDVALGEEDIISTYAALRPLAFSGPESPYDVSRKHRIFETPSGLLCIAGGKFTTFRKMARDLVNVAAEKLARAHGLRAKTGCRTHLTPLPGGDEPISEEKLSSWKQAADLDDKVVEHLAFAYGTEMEKLLGLIRDDPSLGEPILKGLPYLKAQVLYAVEEEMALSLRDFMMRRTRLVCEARDGGLSVAEEVARMMGEALGWGEEKVREEVDAYREEWELTQRFRSE